MRRVRWGCCLIFASALLVVGRTGVCAQLATGRPTSHPDGGDPGESRTRIRATLDYLEGLIGNLASEKSRTEYTSRLAELWAGLDRPKSRDLFRNAFNIINQEETEAIHSSTASPIDLLEFQSLRTMILRRVTVVDPEFARILFEEERDRLVGSDSKGSNVRSKEASRSEALFDYAQILLEGDPKSSAEFAIESLGRGLSPHFSSYLNDLRNRQTEAADSVFAAALRRATASSTPDLSSLLALLGYVFPGDDELGTSSSITVSSVSALDTAKFLSALSTALAGDQIPGHSAPKSLPDHPLTGLERISIIQQHLDLFRRFAPDQVPGLENAVQHFGASVQAASSQSRQDVPASGPLYLNGLSLGQRSIELPGTGAKDESLVQAALEASSRGDWARAQQLSEQVTHAEMRTQARELVTVELAMGSVRSGDFEYAHQLANGLSDQIRRVEIFTFASEHLLRQNRKEEALQWLTEALNQVGFIPGSTRKARALLNLVQIAADLDGSKALETAQMIVSTLNHFESPALSPLQEVPIRSDQKGTKRSLDPSTVQRVSEKSFAEDLDLAFERLGQGDFDQALLVGSQLDSAGRRIPVELSICRGALAHLHQSDRTAASRPWEETRIKSVAGAP